MQANNHPVHTDFAKELGPGFEEGRGNGSKIRKGLFSDPSPIQKEPTNNPRSHWILLRSLRNAVSYTWGSWRGVWNTFELGVSFSGGVYRDSVIVNLSSDAKVLVSSIFNDPPISCRFFLRYLRMYCFCVHEVGFNNKFSRCGGFLCFLLLLFFFFFG